jgi:hypothetical protein
LIEDEDLKNFFARMPKRPLSTLSECIDRWSKRTRDYLRWEKIGIDDYLLALYGRQRIEELLDEEEMSEEQRKELEAADKRFIELSKETKKSVISDIKASGSAKKKRYWFAYRLLSSHYEEWLLYARF